MRIYAYIHIHIHTYTHTNFLIWVTESINQSIRYDTIRYHTIRYDTIPCYTIPYHTIPYHTIPYHTIPYLCTSRVLHATNCFLMHLARFFGNSLSFARNFGNSVHTNCAASAPSIPCPSNTPIISVHTTPTTVWIRN